MSPIPRRAARVLLVDDAERVLLFHGFDPARPQVRYWLTPGGGLEPGERLVDAAVRELAEETGLRLAPQGLGEPVWCEVDEFDFDGRPYRQEQNFFLARVPNWQVITDGFDEVERGFIDAYRWWGVDELESTDEFVHPVVLPALLRRLLRGEPC